MHGMSPRIGQHQRKLGRNREVPFELQCISGIMQELGRGKSDQGPATWMDWLSTGVSMSPIG
jgi:hypothetical protein